MNGTEFSTVHFLLLHGQKSEKTSKNQKVLRYPCKIAEKSI